MREMMENEWKENGVQKFCLEWIVEYESSSISLSRKTTMLDLQVRTSSA
jgi:predicted lipid carrier protein YhbT